MSDTRIYLAYTLAYVVVFCYRIILLSCVFQGVKLQQIEGGSCCLT